ncbi:MAG: SemiSWEET transporter [Bacteroidota bacterium]
MITIIGFIAACLTTGAYIPQVIKTWRTKTTEDLSLGMYSMMTSGIVLWIYYGIVNQDAPVIFANIVAFILTCIILYFKLREVILTRKRKNLS